MLYRLFYISRCVKNSVVDEANIANQIVSFATINNPKLGINLLRKRMRVLLNQLQALPKSFIWQ